MDFTGRIVLSYVEEDNIQRAYFRIRPLLTAEGAVTQADIDALPDEGYLRIVPDKNEQHTFKERMRELAPLCVLDLLNLPADAIKIRTNKNYAPQRGENNQFIVYSDAVQAIPPQLFYEVISAEISDKEKISCAATPLCYLRSGGRINGPVSRATGLEQEGAAPLPPDSEGLYAVTLPDGTEKLFYWPRREHAEAAHNELERAPEAEAPEKKLNGMPLYQTVARRPAMPQRAHNALVDAVGQQLRAGRVEAPGAVLNAGTATRPVENPMDAFRHSLDKLWAMPDMQRQAAAHFLSMTGVQNIINQQLCGKGSDAVARAMNSQIQDLEAERLALLMQVEGSEKKLSALRQEAISQASAAEKETLTRLQQQTADARQDLEKIEVERSKLLEERDALLDEMAKADPDTVYVKGEVGGYAELDSLCDRVQRAMQSAGAQCDKNDALHLLTLLCVAPKQIELAMDARADALAAAHALGRALGVEAVEEAGLVRVREGGDTFRMVIGCEGSDHPEEYTHIIVSPYPEWDDFASGVIAYARYPWPVAHLATAEGWKFSDMPVCPPVKAEAVREALARERVTLPEAALTLLSDLEKALKEAHAPLPNQVRRQMYEYICCTAPRMSGGIADALDYAVSAWVAPHMRYYGVKAEILGDLTQGMPRSLQLLQEDKA